MSHGLFDSTGRRKYLTAVERQAFVAAAVAEGGEIATFCLTLALTGARISEVLSVRVRHVDLRDRAIVFETLKQRKKRIFRAIPVPAGLLQLLIDRHHLNRMPEDSRLWRWGRTTAWKNVKRVMMAADIDDRLCMPKALRHAFAVDAGQNGVQLNIVQRWMGHARMETTAIYANALGKEERALACRTWPKFPGEPKA
jgi:integrase